MPAGEWRALVDRQAHNPRVQNQPPALHILP